MNGRMGCELARLEDGRKKQMANGVIMARIYVPTQMQCTGMTHGDSRNESSLNQVPLSTFLVTGCSTRIFWCELCCMALTEEVWYHGNY